MEPTKTFLTKKNYIELFRAWCSDTRQARFDAQAFESFCNKINEHSTNTAFVLRSNRVGVATVTTLARILEDYPEVDTIDLHENTIRDNGVLALIKLMKLQPKDNSDQLPPVIKHLNIGSNDIGQDGAQALCEFLMSPMCQIKTLILGSDPNELYANKLDDESGNSLAESLKTNSTLTHIDLNRNVLLGKKSQSGFRNLAVSLRFNFNVTTLCLGSTSMSTASAVEILTSLHNYASLTCLDLSSNQLRHEAAFALGKLFTSSQCNVQTLLVRDNLFGSSGLQHLCISLKQNSSLTKLDLSNNSAYSSTESDGIDALADLISSPCELKWIDISHNGIDSEAAVSLGDALGKNNKLEHLDLSNNFLKNEGALALSKPLIGHQSLRSIDLCSTGIGDEGAENIAMALAANSSVVSLNLNDNHLSNRAGKTFVDVLNRNKSLTAFEIRGNQIEHTTLLRVNNILSRNKQLKQEEKPNILRKEIIRLKYVEHKVKEGSNNLLRQRMARSRSEALLGEVEDDIDQLTAINDSKIDEKQTQINLEKTLIKERTEQAEAKIEELKKFEVSSVETIHSLTEAIEKETKSREKQEEQLKQLEQELDRLVNRQDEVLAEIRQDMEGKKSEANRMTEQMKAWRVDTIELRTKIGKLETQVQQKSKIAEIDAMIERARFAKQQAQEEQTDTQSMPSKNLDATH